MPIYKGNNAVNPSRINVGGTKELQKVYVGNTLVWQKETWVLLASFQTNKNGTFNPYIYSDSGTYKWDIDGTEYLGESPSVSLDGSVNDVKIYGTGTCNITHLFFFDQNIYGDIDLSNDAFKTLGEIQLYNNTALTGVTFPSTVTATIGGLFIYNTGITGTLDLSMFDTFSTSAYMQLHANSNMTGITFASSITGTISQLYIYSTGVTGLNISMFQNWISSSRLYVHSNSAMTSLTLPGSITGGFMRAYIYNNTALTGTLNVSGINCFSTGTFSLYGNTSLSGITLPSSISGVAKILYLYSNSWLGYKDLSVFSTTVNTASAHLNLTNCGLTAAEVNHYLVAFDALASASISMQITIAGTNAAPDSSSGGYDGLTALASLIAKGRTVSSN